MSSPTSTSPPPTPRIVLPPYPHQAHNSHPLSAPSLIPQFLAPILAFFSVALRGAHRNITHAINVPYLFVLRFVPEDTRRSLGLPVVLKFTRSSTSGSMGSSLLPSHSPAPEKTTFNFPASKIAHLPPVVGAVVTFFAKMKHEFVQSSKLEKAKVVLFVVCLWVFLSALGGYSAEDIRPLNTDW